MHHHHDHDHQHAHEHEHHHEHCHTREHAATNANHGVSYPHVHGPVLVLRPYTGISGDIMVAGLARMLEADQTCIDECIAMLNMPELRGSIAVIPHALNEVSGWQCRVTLPHEHSHRTFADIRAIIHGSSMTTKAKEFAEKAFAILAEAEGNVHGKEADAVCFHEVGALDSILDTCLAAMLFDRLNPALFVCGPLPVCDGAITCAHGKIPAPAPAVMKLLHGLPVRGIPSSGETITPTGVALLKSFGALFGQWPAMTVKREALIYGTRVFENVPNGAIFAFGEAL